VELDSAPVVSATGDRAVVTGAVAVEGVSPAEFVSEQPINASISPLPAIVGHLALRVGPRGTGSYLRARTSA
jgi:hypothetical protein